MLQLAFWLLKMQTLLQLEAFESLILLDDCIFVFRPSWRRELWWGFDAAEPDVFWYSQGGNLISIAAWICTIDFSFISLVNRIVSGLGNSEGPTILCCRVFRVIIQWWWPKANVSHLFDASEQIDLQFFCLFFILKFITSVWRLIETLKDYAIKALVNTVDHLGSATYKVNDLVNEKAGEVSATEFRVSCIEQVKKMNKMWNLQRKWKK